MPYSSAGSSVAAASGETNSTVAVLLAAGVAFAETVDCVAGEDFCIGTDESDTLNGSEVRDKIFGLAGNDKLYGNDGNDTLRGGDGHDTMEGGAGHDNLKGQVLGNDRLIGGPSPDYLNDEVGRNRMYGGDANDTLYGIGDVLSGGPGDDQIFLYDYDAAGPTAVYGGPGEDGRYTGPCINVSLGPSGSQPSHLDA
jgi:Ca2+-binding RTX toxin-like protein